MTTASARALCDVNLGKSDEEIIAIGATGGVIGIATVPRFFSREHATIDLMLDYIDHIAGVVGWQHIAIGTDWPLQVDLTTLRDVLLKLGRDYGRRDDNADLEAWLDGFTDYRDFSNLTRGLVKRGYPDEQIRGILGENFLRVFEAVCG